MPTSAQRVGMPADPELAIDCTVAPRTAARTMPSRVVGSLPGALFGDDLVEGHARTDAVEELLADGDLADEGQDCGRHVGCRHC